MHISYSMKSFYGLVVTSKPCSDITRPYIWCSIESVVCAFGGLLRVEVTVRSTLREVGTMRKNSITCFLWTLMMLSASVFVYEVRAYGKGCSQGECMQIFCFSVNGNTSSCGGYCGDAQCASDTTSCAMCAEAYCFLPDPAQKCCEGMEIWFSNCTSGCSLACPNNVGATQQAGCSTVSSTGIITTTQYTCETPTSNGDCP